MFVWERKDQLYALWRAVSTFFLTLFEFSGITQPPPPFPPAIPPVISSAHPPRERVNGPLDGGEGAVHPLSREVSGEMGGEKGYDGGGGRRLGG